MILDRPRQLEVWFMEPIHVCIFLSLFQDRCSCILQIVTRLFRPVLLVTVAVAVVNFFRHIHLLSMVRTSCVYKLLVKVFRCTFVVGIVLELTSFRNFAEHRKKVWGSSSNILQLVQTTIVQQPE